MKKQRKLFAILTLVAFMMTLLPIAAFAAPVPADANRFNSNVTVDKTTVDADGEEVAEFTVYVYDKDNTAVANAPVFIASERGTTDTFNAATVNTDANGKAVFTVKSKVAGKVKIAVGLTPDAGKDLAGYLDAKDGYTASAVNLIAVKEVTFRADSASNLNVQDVTVRNRTASSNIAVAPVAGVYTAATWNKANDLDYYEISIKVTNTSGAAVPSEEVKFAVNKSSARLSASTVETDGAGVAKVKVYATKGDTYTVTASAASKSIDTKVEFVAGDVTKIAYTEAQDRVIAKDDRPTFKFSVTDNQGNKVAPAAGAGYAAVNAAYTVEVVSEPSSSDIGTTGFQAKKTSDDLLQIKAPALKKEGNYKFRVSLDNGSYAEVKLSVQKQGTITGIKFSYPQTVLPLEAVSSSASVYRIDAAGVELEIDDTNFNGNNITFSASDYTKISGGIAAATGVFTATKDKDYVGDLTITAVDTANKLSANFTVKITNKMATIAADKPARVEAGKDAIVTLKAIDVNGVNVAIGEPLPAAINKTVELVDYYVTAKPEGAAVSVDESKQFEDNLKEDGKTTVAINSSKAGTVNVTLRIKVYDNEYNIPVVAEFGAERVQTGAKAVTLFIGSSAYVADGAAKQLDVAPFIKDNRTFVPVRVVAEALGATNSETMWDAATQTVTIERGDKTITMKIGSNILTISDGTTVVADVAPFIKDGRTVLPFRAIAEAFGAEVEAVANADGTTSAVTFTNN